ncbi:UNVERIFIED_CONTAM: Retrovirus-related Pol polyprotein from transposon RE2, partial [Sesamum latifolium]
FRNKGYVLDKPLPTALPEGSSPEERVTFDKWHEDNHKVRSIILASMTNEIQKQYDRLEDVLSIMLRMKDVYAVPDRHIRYAATKHFLGPRWPKSIHELINMLVQYEVTTRKFEPSVLVGEASTSKAKGKGARRWKRKKGKGTAVTATASTGGAPPTARRERARKRSGVLSSQRQMMCAFIAMERGTGRGSVQNSSRTQVLQRSRKLSKDEMILRLGDGKAVAAEAVGSLSLVSNLIMTAQHKRKVDDHENAQIWHAMLGHISKDRIRRLVDTKSLEIDDLDHLPTCESCLKGKMTKKPFVGESAIAKENGILSQWTPPGMLQLNGVAERRNRTLLDMVRSMMSFTELPRPSGVMHLRRQLSCLTYRHLSQYPRRHMRYAMASLPPTTEQKIFVSRNAVFLEKGFPSDNQRDEVLIEESSGEPPHNSTTSFEPTVHTDSVPILRRSIREFRVPERYGFVGLTSQLDKDPKTYREAMSDINSDKWLEAMKSKMDSMGSNQVWTLVDPSKGVGPVGCKWVYKRKLGANGEVTAFKARLVAKGYTQRPGVDFEETYSPVAMAKSIRILLAIAAWYDYEIWRMNVKTAFLNGFVEEEIFMDQPEGFTTVGEEQKNDYDPCEYKKISGSSVAYLVLYIDDILLIENDVKMLGTLSMVVHSVLHEGHE